MDLPIPCPIDAGWELVRRVALPREGADGLPLGGFSAAAYLPESDRLWLLSDAPQGHLVPWGGLARVLRNPRAKLNPGPRLLLKDNAGRLLPPHFDGEGLVLDQDRAWIVSEGRRTATRSAGLLRFSLQTGRQQESLPLPSSWVASPGKGLAANKGPESLTMLGSGDLLMAAENRCCRAMRTRQFLWHEASLEPPHNRWDRSISVRLPRLMGSPICWRCHASGVSSPWCGATNRPWHGLLTCCCFP